MLVLTKTVNTNPIGKHCFDSWGFCIR